MNQEKAQKMVERAFSGGTDIEDAKEYLDSLKEHYKKEYNQLIEEGKRSVQEARKKQEEDMKKAKDTLLKGSNILGDIEVDAKTRQ
jgi:hemerythrin-like domain-containing protein